MSDLNPVIPNGIGSPRAWLFTNDGEPLLDFDEQIIAKFLTKFRYRYNEEEDDECELVFKFPTLRSFDLPYFQQDVILNVEWGYIVTDGSVIKSPRRKIAIRDLETDYKKDGIELIIKCTDLVSYLKGMKTQRVNQYRTVGGESITGSRTGDITSKGSKELEDLFYNEVINGADKQINIRKKEGNKVTVLNKKGNIQTGIKNEKNGRFQPVKENVWSGGNQTPQRSAVLPLKDKAISNLGNTSFDKAVRTKLKWANELDKVNSGGGISKLSDSDGPTIADGTDDNLEIKTRDFSQPIFKQFTYYGGSGELLSFKSSTETRKNKENKTISSGVDPYSKKIVSHTIDTIDTKTLEPGNTTKGKTIGQLLAQNSTQQPSGKYSEEVLKQTFENRKEVWQQRINTLNPGLAYKKEIKEVKTVGDPRITPYMGYAAKRTKVDIHNTADIIASPEFKDYANKHRNPELKSFDPSSSGTGVKKILTGYTIETIQRKYTASAETIGDPSLIKGKIYSFNNLGRLHRGKWYATSIEHNLEMDKGYTCNLELMQNPKAIGISAKTNAANPEFNRVSGDILLNQETNVTESVIYDQKDEEDNSNIENMDNVQQESKYRQEDVIQGMDERLDYLKAEEDSFRELEENDEYKVETLNEYIHKPTPNSQNL